MARWFGGCASVPLLVGASAGCQGSATTPQGGQTEQVDTSTSALGSEGDGIYQGAVEALKHPPNREWTPVDDRIPGPVWAGDDDKGSVYGPLFRGGFPGMEDYIFTPDDGDCTKMKATIRVDWDKAANTVHFLLKGVHFPQSPTVTRTEGETWWPDPFHKAPKDVVGGAYRLWLLLGSTTKTAKFYYDPNTLKLLGSDYDFASSAPPTGVPTVVFPIFSTTGSNEFDPDADGNVIHEFTLRYDGVTNESGTFSRAYASFVPLDLCQALPLQPAKSQLRPYGTPWQPPAQAPVWRDMLRAGIGFSMQLDERVPLDNGYGGNLPYVYSGIDVASNLFSTQGGIPRGWSNQIIAAIMNVSPIFAPVPFGDGLGCKPYVQEPTHVTAPLYCQGQK